MVNIIEVKGNEEIKKIRKTMRAMDSYSDVIIVEGWGQIKKTGKSYAHGPLPEHDDSDPMTDYSAWTYGWKETWLLDDIKRFMNIA